MFLAWTDTITGTLAVLGMLSVGAVAYFKVRADAKTAVDASTDRTIKLIKQERDELARQLQIRDVTIQTLKDQMAVQRDAHAAEILALREQVETLTSLVTKSADVDRLTNLMTEQHQAIRQALVDIKNLLGAGRSGDDTSRE